MSTFNVIALAIAALIGTVAVAVWIQGKAGIVAREVHTGVIQAVPVSDRARRLWLHQMFVSYQTSNFVLNAGVGFGLYRLARATASTVASDVALLIAWILFIGAFSVISLSAVTVAGLSRSIRLGHRSSFDPNQPKHG